MRGRRAGYRSLFVPSARIWHKISVSGIDPARVYYMTRNRFWFVKRNANRLQKVTFVCYFASWCFWITPALLLVSRGGFSAIRSFIQGIVDAIESKSAEGSA